MTPMTGGRAVVEAIDRERVEHVFLVPGESLLSVLDGPYEHPRLKVHAAGHEGGASIVPLGNARSLRDARRYAWRSEGRAPRTLSIGLTAWRKDSVLMAFVTQAGTWVGDENPSADLVGMLRPHCKAVTKLSRMDRVAEQTQAPFGIGQEGRPRVVAVVIPEDTRRPTCDFEFRR